MNELTTRWADGCIDGWIAHMNTKITQDQSTGGWRDRWMDGWMDGWMDRWMDGCDLHFTVNPIRVATSPIWVVPDRQRVFSSSSYGRIPEQQRCWGSPGIIV